jgi:hypothetical protein
MFLTTETCFNDESFTAWWDAVEEENCNQGWDDDVRLEVLISLYETSYSPEFAARYVKENVYDDEFESVYDWK